MNHTVFQIDPADSRFTDTFARFFTDCGEYELFSDCDTPYFAVFSDIDRTHCTGLQLFLSVKMNPLQKRRWQLSYCRTIADRAFLPPFAGRHTTKSKHSTRIVCLPAFSLIF